MGFTADRCGLPVQGGRGLRGGLLRLGGVQDLAAAFHRHDVRGSCIIGGSDAHCCPAIFGERLGPRFVHIFTLNSNRHDVRLEWPGECDGAPYHSF